MRNSGSAVRLQVEHGQRDPSPGAADADPEEEHVDEQREHADVEQVRLLGERAVVEHQRQNEADRTERDRPQLRDEEVGVGAPARTFRRAVDHRDADRAQRPDGADHRPVEMIVETAFEHASRQRSAVICESIHSCS
jgi:hypothetical protein